MQFVGRKNLSAKNEFVKRVQEIPLILRPVSHTEPYLFGGPLTGARDGHHHNQFALGWRFLSRQGRFFGLCV